MSERDENALVDWDEFDRKMQDADETWRHLVRTARDHERRLTALECETADTPEDVSTSESRAGEPAGKPGNPQEIDRDFPETPDFRAQENGATCANNPTLPDAQADGLSAESPPTGDGPHTECIVSARGAKRLRAEVEK